MGNAKGQGCKLCTPEDAPALSNPALLGSAAAKKRVLGVGSLTNLAQSCLFLLVFLCSGVGFPPFSVKSSQKVDPQSTALLVENSLPQLLRLPPLVRYLSHDPCRTMFCGGGGGIYNQLYLPPQEGTALSHFKGSARQGVSHFGGGWEGPIT